MLPNRPFSTLALLVALVSSIAVTASSDEKIRAPALPATSQKPASPEAAAPAVATSYEVPDFTAFHDVQKRKSAFYQYLLPKIRQANQEVMGERRWLLDIAARLVGSQPLSTDQLHVLAAMEARYSVAPGGSIVNRVRKLLKRVDVVPASLILAQAAQESGWGTSRFAVEGNNFFGIWCFSHGCGIVPGRRDAGRTHEVAMFDSVADGVRYYIRTLNSQPAYRELREIRAKARLQHQSAPGDQLAQGLVRYSERGVSYVKAIQTIIHYNNLHRFTLSHEEA